MESSGKEDDKKKELDDSGCVQDGKKPYSPINVRNLTRLFIKNVFNF